MANIREMAKTQFAKSRMPSKCLKTTTFVFGLFSLFFFTPLIQAREWTIMVYMCGDNGMSNQTSDDLSEMITVGSTPQVQIIVQVDNLPSAPNPTTRRYRIEQDTLRLIADLGEKNMADLNVILDFIRYCRTSYPAKNYCLILWDHGSGWYPTFGAMQRSIIYDYTNHDSISVTAGELRQLLTEIRKTLGKKLNLLVFDACLMGGIEVAYEVKDGAEIMVGSEALIPFDGLPYDAILYTIVTQPELTPKAFAQAIVQNYANSYNNGSQGLVDVTLSAVDLKQLEHFATELGSLLEDLKNFAQDSIFLNTRNTVQTFPEENIRLPEPTDDCIDLFDFLQKSKVINLGRYEPVLRIWDSLVLANSYTKTYYPKAYGLSIWFPHHYLKFKQRAFDYQKLAFAQKTGWLEFLNQYYNSDDIKPPMVKSVEVSKIGLRNNFKVYWQSVYDFAQVTYELIEVADDTILFVDLANNFDAWHSTNFTLSSIHAYSPFQSFFSGNGNSLTSQLELKNPISLPNGGLLSFYAFYNTEENIQSGKLKRDIFYVTITNDSQWQTIDSIYGTTDIWVEFRYLLPSFSNCRIRFFYKTDSTVYLPDGGVYIDDIKIYGFGHKRTVVANYPDTVYNIFNVPKNIFRYGVIPIDGFGNKGMVSQFSSAVLIKTYAEPYSRPNPFFEDCNLICDFPAGEEPNVYIYTLSGELVIKFPFEKIINNQIYWTGKNWKDREIGSGIYLVLVKGKQFTRLGKIAKVR